MTTADARRFHQEAWTRLYDLIVMRNKLLQRLDIMAGRAVSATPASSMVFEFDTTQARDILAKIDELTPRIAAAMNEANQYAEQLGKPRMRWQSVTFNTGMMRFG
jgi:hypothetical protein